MSATFSQLRASFIGLLGEKLYDALNKMAPCKIRGSGSPDELNVDCTEHALDIWDALKGLLDKGKAALKAEKNERKFWHHVVNIVSEMT